MSFQQAILFILYLGAIGALVWGVARLIRHFSPAQTLSAEDSDSRESEISPPPVIEGSAPSERELSEGISCSNCMKVVDPGDISREIKIYSARVTGSRSEEVAGGTTLKTTYGDFQEHHYPLCSECSASWSVKSSSAWILGAGAFFYGIYLIIRVVGAGDPTGTDFLLFTIFLLGGILMFTAAEHLWGDERFLRVAKKERGEGYEAFTEEEYRELKTEVRWIQQ